MNDNITQFNEEYLTPKDIEKILGFSKKKTYAIINKADFPKIRIGRDIRIPKSKFENFMEKLLYKDYKI